ncbi:MAG: hypothetical protein ABIR68_08450 [Ilumatobacteraceae bacterium]
MAPTTFVHVVAPGEGPLQVAAWFDQIGKSSLYRKTKALHRALPTGTVITVVGDTVRIS